jgi:hypothetical protein
MTDEDQPTPEPTEDLGDAGKKALKAERDRAAAAERSLRAKEAELADATSRLGAFEAQIGDLTKQVSDRELVNTRLTIGLEKGLSKAHIDRLQGSTAEELAADADQLLELFPIAKPAESSNTNPRPDLSQGVRGIGRSDPKDQFAAWAADAFKP